MNTKGILIAILALGSITLINAQQPAGYFFKEFTPGKVLLKTISILIIKSLEEGLLKVVLTP